MVTPFSQAPAPDAVRGAALQGIRDRGTPQPAAPVPAGGAIPTAGGGVPEKFAELTQLIMQNGLTDEVLSAFEQFIQFFQGVVQQASGGAQAPAQAPVQAPPGPAVPQGPGTPVPPVG